VGHGHPQDGGRELLHTRVGLQPVCIGETAFAELKGPTKEIKQLASNRCPVPFSLACWAASPSRRETADCPSTRDKVNPTIGFGLDTLLQSLPKRLTAARFQ
jgi:hypothetical protein